MSNIPELLKMGFENDDWSYISEAYHMLMGEYLLVDKPEPDQPAIEEPQGFSKEVRRKDESSYISPAYDGGHRPEFKSTGDGEGQAARKEPMNLSKNRELWQDDGTIAANEKVSENPSLGVANPVERNRRPQRARTNSDIRLDKSEKLKDINE